MTPALHKTAYNRAKTARAVSPERSEPRKRSLEGCAFAPVGGALASFIGETLAKAAPGKSRAAAEAITIVRIMVLVPELRACRNDMMVNPIMYTIRDWDARRGTPFYKNVMRDGIPLWT